MRSDNQLTIDALRALIQLLKQFIDLNNLTDEWVDYLDEHIERMDNFMN